jgi:hypothetical protein
MTGEIGYRVSRFLLRLAVSACLLFVVLKFWQAVVSGFEGDSLRELATTLTSPISLIIVVGAAVNIFLVPTVHRFNRQFQVGRHGDYAALPLAPVQPTPDAMALALPTTITMRSRWPAKILGAIIASLMVALGVAFFSLSFTVPIAITNPSESDIAIFIPTGVTCFFVIFALAVGFRPERKTLEITETGIYHRQTGHPDQSIQWQDVRLFAIAASRGSKSNPPQVVYTLASPEAFVMWGRIHRLDWNAYERPTAPFEEYNQQMEALLSLIAARTGLPLYDLR